MTCSSCNKKTDTLLTADVRGELVEDVCKTCLGLKQTAGYSAKFQRDRMRENHRKDLIQRWEGNEPNPEFARAYQDQARNEFGEEFVRNS